MSKRPYLSKSIVELEAIYQSSGGDKVITDRLLGELAFRTVPKAETLKVRIAQDRAAHKAAALPEKATPIKLRPVATPSEHIEPPSVVRSSPIVKPMQMPPITNKANDVLSAWTALEVLSPNGFKKELDLVPGDRAALVMFEQSDLPWEISQTSRKNKRLYFELYFGTIAMAPAVDSLLNVYSDSRPEKPSVKGFSPIASVILDKEGKPLEEEASASISSFAWGVPVALGGDLRKLAEWPEHEKAITKSFRERLIKRDRNNEIKALTKGHIRDVYKWLVDVLKLGDLETKAPYFALKRFEWMYSKNPPEPNLLNSFYLEDLETARSLVVANDAPKALAHYLGTKSPAKRTDLFQDSLGLQDLLQPKFFPAGRWPGKGRYPLSLLQQAAVNATEIDRMQTGILGVNGPPGTGKTTLLRDVVAARVVERANVMATFDRPSQAFEPSQVTVSRNGATITLHRLNNRLKGFEMVVASSNNKAVENVSAELPSIDAVAEDAPSLRYFQAISDNVLKIPTWGLAAAVLGNSSNRFQFSQDFWKDEELGFSTYLNHVSGQPQIVVVPQDDGPPIRRLREIIDRECPPQNAREAAARWESARRKFQTAKLAFDEQQTRIQTLHTQIKRVVDIQIEYLTAVEQRRHLEGRGREIDGQLPILKATINQRESELTGTLEQTRLHDREKPALFRRLFRTATYREWMKTHKILLGVAEQQEGILLPLKKQLDTINLEIRQMGAVLSKTTSTISALNEELVELQVAITKGKAALGAEIPDQDFFARPHEEIQLLNVWFDKDANILRDNVFEAALLLHRAFIDCSADQLRQNLSIFMESFGTRTLGNPEKDAMIPDLWASLFLVVPLISSTFASVHRMFSRLKPETLGWLLVDEAGQAVPQAVVGAMMRTKYSIVVGDPLQIEPVVTLPNSLTERVCSFFGIDPLRFNAPEASVQTLADAASVYCARFPMGSGHRNVGAPLLVHRRCNSPMFDISNEIAYANLMVQAKRSTPDNKTLGRSAWIDVVSQSSTDKWSYEECAALIRMLWRLRQDGHDADLYIVTPFVIVQDNLRNELIKSKVLEGWVIDPREWASKRVGTVHTVQGREASIVFFVLGAPLPSQTGARTWAGGRPNLVNVAVTRAKTTLYVIGNRKLWRTSGNFAALDRFLPHK